MAKLTAYDGVTLPDLAERTGTPRILAFDMVGSTMDAAHGLAREGAAHGTVVIAEEQSAGRGRARREWISPRGGIWLSLVARDVDSAHLGALPLRVGIAAARVLDAFSSDRVLLKWPNDLYVPGGKLGGVLVEARWRDTVLDWAAVGIGVNLLPPAGVEAAGLDASARRATVAELLIPALRDAISLRDPLSAAELAEFASRDIARGRRVVGPVEGIVRGVASSGALLVEVAGALHEVSSGSLVFSAAPRSVSANG